MTADYIVRDISLADWGRKEIEIAETEMPGLMARARGVRQGPAAEGRPHRRLAAHDHPDRGADRDAAGAGRRRALGLVQHLLDPGPRRRRHRRRTGTPVFAVKGETLVEYWEYAHTHLRVGRRRLPEPDPRRRRRRHPADCVLGPKAEKDASVLDNPQNEEEEALYAVMKRYLKEKPGFYSAIRDAITGRVGGDHHRRAPPLPDGRARRAAVPGHQRQRQRHQVEVRQPLRLPREPGRRHPPRHRRDAGRQGGGGLRLRRRGQGLGGLAAQRRRPRGGHRDRPDLRPAGGDGRLRGPDPRGRGRRAPTSSSPPPATRTCSPSTTCGR